MLQTSYRQNRIREQLELGPRWSSSSKKQRNPVRFIDHDKINT